MDNALDAAEEAEVAPVITIIVDPGSIIIEDNAGGIDGRDHQVDPRLLDPGLEPARPTSRRPAARKAMRSRRSWRWATCSIASAGSDAEAAGVTIIETRGIEHRIEFRVDHINNQPKITHTTAASPVNDRDQDHNQMAGPTDDLLDYAEDDSNSSLRSYVWFNPHLTLRGVWFGQEFVNVAATNPNWEKWWPRNPTSPHWYDETRLQRYLAAHVARDRDLGRQRTVREFIAEFRGLSGTAVQRKVLEEVGCSHQSLAQFFGVEQVNRSGIAKLLAAMRKHSKPVAPKHLGVIGVEHLKQRFLAAGGNAETFKYQSRKGMTSEGIPYIVEFAFGLHQSGLTQGGAACPASSSPARTGASGSAIRSAPSDQPAKGWRAPWPRCGPTPAQPVICALHLASAYIQYADRGKSSIILTDNAEQPDD